MKVLSVPGSRAPAIRIVAVVAVLGLVSFLGAVPALAHGEEGDADPVDLVEQALAIVVNTPEAVGEALERVEAALEAEAEEPSGELDVDALSEAAAALEEGRLHDAEDALVQALGRDPHPDEATTEAPAATVAPQPSAPGTVAESPPDTTGGPAEVGHDDEGTEPDHDDEATAEPSHGLTSRVEGGFTAPGPAEATALAVAAALAVAGLFLVRGKE